MITRNINDDNTLSYLFNNQKKSSDKANETADAAQAAADAAQADLDDFKERFGLLVYPVGSIYLSTSETSPASLFGGTWVRIEDTFLLAAGEIYQPGDTGGEAQHTITVAEMPSHGHPVAFHNNAGTKGTAFYYVGDVKTNSTSAQSPGVTWKGTTFTCAQKGHGDYAGGADLVGGGQSHNNMPPYLSVYVWERTE